MSTIEVADGAAARGVGPHTPLSVSAVIVTRDRPGCIESAVSSVLANDYPRFDLTVVDQSTTDATKRALQPFVDADSRLRYLNVAVAGVSRAYNAAIRGSAGEILAFTDDDCVVPVDWLTTIVRAFASDADADLLFGDVHPPRRPDQPQGITPQLFYPRAQRLLGPRRFGLGFKVWGGMGANFAARRRLFGRVGGFDELLGPGTELPSGQDFDIAYRALCAGSAVLLRPDVRVTHEYGTRSHAEWSTRIRDYAVGDGALYFKHVRSGDLFALWLFARWLARSGGRPIIKRLLGRGPAELAYVRALLRGVRRSLRFDVDPRARLYVRR